MGMISAVVINDKDGALDTEARSMDVTGYFHDDGALMYTATVVSEPTNVDTNGDPDVGSATDVTVAESEEAPGTFAIALKDGVIVTNPNAGQVSARYGDAMVSVTAMDTGMLWTTQEFMVRRNRRAIAIPDLQTVMNDVGTNDKANTLELKVGSFFTDDDTIIFASASLDDTEKASVSYAGDTVTVMGLTGGDTALRVKVVDTGGLISVQQNITVTVDPGLKVSEKAMADVESSLLRDAEMEPIYTLPGTAASYFERVDSTDTDTLTYTAKSSVESVASVPESITDTLVATLKAVGTTEITLTVTEAEGDGVEQSISRSFMLTVTSPS
jgi:hypothetical protein